LIGAFKKKRALLGEKQWEARQVDLPRINLSLRKIGVNRKDGDELRRDLPGHIATFTCLP